ncbi:MAG: hypothetical protein K2Q34_03405, partial [Alphaproteobacteria bacterium]|nr:hypothetical protein [Alphaproteobacteria bacterium]
MFFININHNIALSAEAEDPFRMENQNLHDVFKCCKTTLKSFVSSIEKDPTELDKVMDANLIVLTRGDEESLIQGLMNYALFINSVKDRPLEVMPWYGPYEARLTELSGHSNPMIRQLTFLVLASTLEKRERYLSSNVGLYAEAEALLGEARVSSYSFIKYLSYLILNDAATKSGNLEHAMTVLEEAIVAVPLYSLKLHKRMYRFSVPDLETEKRYFARRMVSLGKLIDEGTPKQKMRAQLYLAGFFSHSGLKELESYKPEEALKIYAQLLADKDSISQELYEKTLTECTSLLSYSNNPAYQKEAFALIQ